MFGREEWLLETVGELDCVDGLFLEDGPEGDVTAGLRLVWIEA